ncbi:shufflon system plasmid conjugative transfer pilus tip adhesin PilV [Rahnella aceris]|uniref:shufflon system plasmid conjugative transfer pilus tip adhesin PilV n=1 Tax=Rahnella sp. (strain Y9602) TaxID=2703885 RepID=UPI0034603474
MNATSNVTANNSITAGNVITAGSDIRSNNGWLITRDSKGWLNETHGGGFTMTDNDWVRAINDKNIYTGGQVRGGSVRADDRLSAGGILQLDQINNEGWGCDAGGVSHDSTGALLSCQSGVWKRQTPAFDIQTVISPSACTNLTAAYATCPAGTKLISGGYQLTKWTEGGSYNFPDSNYADNPGNRWVITTPNNQGKPSCYAAVASCVRQ